MELNLVIIYSVYIFFFYFGENIISICARKYHYCRYLTRPIYSAPFEKERKRNNGVVEKVLLFLLQVLIIEDRSLNC